MTIIKSLFYFCLSYFVLSWEISGRTIFDRIDAKIAPYTESAQSYVVKKTKNTWSYLKNSTMNIIGSKIPDHDDNVTSGLASLKRKERANIRPQLKENSIRDPDDNYTPEERKLLRKILEEAQ